MKTDMRMELWPIENLHPAEYNPRVHLQPGDPEYESIARSIETFGYADPIIVNTDGTIIGGHQRFTVLSDLGYKEVHVVVVDLTKDKEKALNIALNKISGAWDEEKLKALLQDIDLSGLDMTLTGFTAAEYEDLCVSLEGNIEPQEDADFDADAAYEAAAEPVTRRGDIWILGEHRLMCGDSTDAADVSALMAGEDADLVITDPPYNVAYEGKAEELVDRGEETIANDSMSDEEFEAFLLDFYICARDVMRPGAGIYVFHADANGYWFRKAYRDAGLKLAQCLIWEKNTFVLGRQDYQWRHEPILYGWKEGAGHYFINDRTQDTIFYEDDVDFEAMKKDELVAYLKDLKKNFSYRTSVLFENKPVKADIHPTMKPVSLVGRLMLNSSKPDWAVYDPFGGSGTTLIAAEQLGRRAYMMELDPRFCDVIIRRWEEYTGRTAKREE